MPKLVCITLATQHIGSDAGTLQGQVIAVLCTSLELKETPVVRDVISNKPRILLFLAQLRYPSPFGQVMRLQHCSMAHSHKYQTDERIGGSDVAGSSIARWQPRRPALSSSINDAHRKRQCTNGGVKLAEALLLMSKQSLQVQRHGSQVSLVQTVPTILQGFSDFWARTLCKQTASMCSVDVAVDQLTRCNPCILMPRTLSFPEASSLSETGSRLGSNSNVSTRTESSSEGCCSPGLE